MAYDPEILQETAEAIKKFGRNGKAAASLGIPARTFYDRANAVEAAARPVVHPTLTPREIRDAEFWRRKYEDERKSRAEIEHMFEHMAGLAQMRVDPPEWAAPLGDKRRGRAVLGVLLSDLHFGEVIRADEILNVNAFDLEIARRRLRRYFSAACEIGQRWGSDAKIAGCFAALAGDLISGDIHNELSKTNALTSTESVIVAAQEIAAGLLKLADAFGCVHVVSVPGNHGRTTIKPEAKLASRSSYDTLIAKMIADTLARDKRITLDIPPGIDVRVQILGKGIFVTHGDRMGTGGGQGFAGPVLPIIRGVKKTEIQQFHARQSFDLLLHGHYHTTANAGNSLSNGALPGYSEYGNGLRCSIEPPQQWLFLMTERWGLRERMPIVLEDPGAFGNAKVRSPFR